MKLSQMKKENRMRFKVVYSISKMHTKMMIRQTQMHLRCLRRK